MRNRNDFFESLLNEFFKGGRGFSSISFFGTNESDFSYPKDGDANFHKTVENVETETHTIKREVWTSIDGKQRFERTTENSKSMGELKPSKKDLQLQLNEAISSQNFEEACKLRDQIKSLEKVK
jgi:excinuclease UvrABC helicase subunit UvrB